MAESFSITAILSAYDKGFTAAMKQASKSTDSLGSKIKNSLSFGVFTGMGQRAFDAISGGVQSLIGDMSSANATWKTFAGNMEIIGKTEKEINSAKKTLQKYAEQTVYSSSDMASTYAQLAAVGVKSTDRLVIGFGGLAAAAENPQQAMKTLSQQATQMAAKPQVAWADFKLMLEQTPAGIAAVAKQMGMTASQLVSNVQGGKVSTEEFFNAISEVGNNPGFSKMATEAKTVGQAMDGLKETAANKLGPAFDVLSEKGIGFVNSLSDKIAGIDGEALAGKVSAGIKAAQPYWESFKSVIKQVAGAIKTFGGFLNEHKDVISKVLPYVIRFAIALKAFGIVKGIFPGVAGFTKAITGLAGKGIGAIAGKLFGISKSQEQVGKSSVTSGKQMFAAAKSYALMGVAVLTIAAGFSVLAFSAIALAKSGGGAIGVMVGLVAALAALGFGMGALLKSLAPMEKKLMPVSAAMLALAAAVLIIAVAFGLLAFTAIKLAAAGGGAIAVMAGIVVVIALLSVGAAALGTALTAGAVGFIAFGAALLLAGVGAVLAAAALQILTPLLPLIAEHGFSGALALLSLGGAMIVFAVGAALAGVSCIILAAGVLLLGLAVAVLGIGILALGTGMLLVASAMAVMAAILPVITQYGLQGAVAIAALGASIVVLGLGAVTAGAGILILGAGLLVATLALAAVSVVLLLAAGGMTLLAASTLLLGTGLLTAGAGLIVFITMLPVAAGMVMLLTASFTLLMTLSIALGAMLLVAAAGVSAFGVAALVAGAGAMAFGAGMMISSAGMIAMSVGLKGVNSQMKSISKNAKATEKSLNSMRKSVKVVESGLNALGSKAKSAMKAITSAFDSTAKKAKSSGQKVGTDFVMGMQLGLSSAPAAAMLAVVQVNAALSSGEKKAYAAGVFIGQGFAMGMLSQLAWIQSAAKKMAAAADEAVRTKLKIHSPSKVAEDSAEYYGIGFIGQFKAMRKKVWKSAQDLVSIPAVSTPDLSLAYNRELSADYDYYRNAEYTIVVPLNLDGREVAKATVQYNQEELDRRQTRERRKKGKV